VWKFSPVVPSLPFKNIYAFKDLEAARADNSFGQLKGEAAAIQRNITAYENGDSSQWGWFKIYGPDGVYKYALEYMEKNLYMWDKFTGAPTPTMSISMNTLKQIEREVFVKIVMGAVSADEFDKFVADWYQVGGGDITDEVNAWYASQP
jgi:putative aldouronate transport system substrate-binding protein